MVHMLPRGSELILPSNAILSLAVSGRVKRCI
jgi:hypothetical protein